MAKGWGEFGSFNDKEKSERKTKNAMEDHVTNLYDEGGDIDEATGKKIDNSPIVEGVDEALTVHELHAENGHLDILPPLEKENDAAAQWLAAEEARLKKEKGEEDLPKAA